ncbi:hypothetical protein H2204_003766 [Knufia peltigerae]|uniref:Uncharacterized protein n=1 Tax=Knufia peltigerae TaxID=1002370 RepID=A0AA39CZC8_9EURO|nr:hypothetical protein H2204_003766 [Knufia peltigerae]
MPPPNERQILTSYLLHPSPLPTILPYASFQSLFPSATSRTTHKDIKPFYRNLQSQRDGTLDDVRRRIRDECRRSTFLTTRLARQITREEQSNPTSRKRKWSETTTTRDQECDDTSSVDSDIEEENPRLNDKDNSDYTDVETDNQVEVDLDTRLHGPHGSTIPSTTARQHHGATSLLDAMKTASSDLQDEISSLEAQIAAVQAQCQESLGNLSDLRYGRFSQTRVSGQQSGVDGRNDDGTSIHSQQQQQQQQGIEKEVVDALAEFRARLQTV